MSEMIEVLEVLEVLLFQLQRWLWVQHKRRQCTLAWHGSAAGKSVLKRERGCRT